MKVKVSVTASIVVEVPDAEVQAIAPRGANEDVRTGVAVREAERRARATLCLGAPEFSITRAEVESVEP